MKQHKKLLLEHNNMMYYSREIIQLCIPKEINIMFYTIVSLVICVSVLLVTVRINDVVKVTGIVRTEANNSSVNNVLAGQIEAIYYKQDQFVEKGEILFSLKKDVYQTIKKDLEDEIEDNKKELRCTEILLNCCENGEKINNDYGDNSFVEAKVHEYFSNVEYLKRQIAIYEYKYEKIVNQPEIFFRQSDLDEASLSLQLGQQELVNYQTSFISENIQKKKALELNIDKLEQELIRTNEQYSFLDIRAPVSGFVQEITALNIGDYVVDNQNILVIIPNDKMNFKVELSIPTKDIGEITEGMKVKYRLSAFPFYEYKGAEGVIESIDSDVRQSSSGQLFYKVCSDIDRVSFRSKKDVEYSIRPGIEVDARIVLEKISVIHFILRKMDFVQ